MPRRKTVPKSRKAFPPNTQAENSRAAASLGESDSSEPDVSDHNSESDGVLSSSRFYKTPTPRQARSVQQQQQQQHQSTQRARQRNQRTRIQRERRLMMEIMKLQTGTNHLIPKLPFSRLVREIIMQYSRGPMMVTPEAFMALQEATEMYVTQRLQDAYMLTLHRQRVTLACSDLQLLEYLKRA